MILESSYTFLIRSKLELRGRRQVRAAVAVAAIKLKYANMTVIKARPFF